MTQGPSLQTVGEGSSISKIATVNVLVCGYYCIAGNFRILRIIEHHPNRNVPCTIIMFYVTMLSCTNIEILKWVFHTKMCTDENYPLYGMMLYNNYSAS